VGVSPIASTALTGFTLTLDGTGTFSTSTQVTGKLYAASYSSPTPSVLGTAIEDLVTAYNDAAGRVNPDHTDLDSGKCRLNILPKVVLMLIHSGLIGGATLTPGLYKWNSAVNITASITISGGATDSMTFSLSLIIEKR
jgi:Ice-binding-like